MSNYGLDSILPPSTELDVQNYQGLPSTNGVNNIKKGYNEYLLYGSRFSADSLDINVDAYYFYTAMTWNEKNRPITTDGVGRGLFFYSEINQTAEGWWCEHDSSQTYNWSCYST